MLGQLSVVNPVKGVLLFFFFLGHLPCATRFLKNTLPIDAQFTASTVGSLRYVIYFLHVPCARH